MNTVMTSSDWTRRLLTSRGNSFSFCFDLLTMAETATSNEIQQNPVYETPVLATTDQSTLDSSITHEPPRKKTKIPSPEKPRLLEERIGSILSCCICLDLSTLAMFQVTRDEENSFRILLSCSLFFSVSTVISCVHRVLIIC